MHIRSLVLPIILIFPPAALLFKNVGSILLFVLTGLGVLLALYYCLPSKTPPCRWRDFSRLEKWLLLCFVLFPLSALLSWIVGDASREGMKQFESAARLFTFIPIYFLFRQLDLSENVLLRGFAIGALLAGITTLLAMKWGIGPISIMPYTERAAGPYGESTLGQWAMLFTMLSLLIYPTVRHHRGKQLLLLLCVVSGLFATMVSGVRGVWIAFPVLAVLVYFYFRAYFTWKTICIAGAACAIAFVVTAQLLSSKTTLSISELISSRMTTAVQEVVDYIKYSDVDESVRRTSTGLRFEMWKGSWNMFKEAPLLGIGEGAYRNHVQAQAEQGLITASAATFHHPHNEFLRVLGQRGLVGLATLLAIFILPWWFFMRATKGHNTQRVMGFCGLIICTSYLIFGLTEILFARNVVVALYIISIAYTIAAIQRKS